MKIVFISDTHGLHKKLLNLPDADMIIHGGDISNLGQRNEILDFIQWFSSLKYKYKIFIAGNHDFFFEDETSETIQNIIPDNVHYLNDSEVIIEGIRIWGSPVSPRFCNWAFNRDRGADIRKHWEIIPFGTKILVTHGPPLGILDNTSYGDRVGCLDLLDRVNMIRPKYHLFGHIHEAYGIQNLDATTFINGSFLNGKSNSLNEPMVFDIFEG